MAKSLDHVLQSDGTYKWELVEQKAKVQKGAEVSAAPAPMTTKKKVAKKKTDSRISE